MTKEEFLKKITTTNDVKSVARIKAKTYNFKTRFFIYEKHNNF